MAYTQWREPGRPLGTKKKRSKLPAAESHVPQRRQPAKRPDFRTVRDQFMTALMSLQANDLARVPNGTLPEMMVAWALIKNHWIFQSQSREGGGRLRLGGATIDFVVWLGSSKVVVRVMGDYWHTLPERVNKDELQLQLLQLKGYRVADLWEYRIYQAWMEGRLIQYIRDEVNSAQ